MDGYFAHGFMIGFSGVLCTTMYTIYDALLDFQPSVGSKSDQPKMLGFNPLLSGIETILWLGLSHLPCCMIMLIWYVILTKVK